MSRLLINGNIPLNGEIILQGAKNSVLPILASCVLVSGQCIIHNCPNLSDVKSSVKILRYLGANVETSDHTLIVDSSNINKCDIPDFLMKEMRSSIIFLGAILSRFKKASLTFPGGCELGPRPIDFHLKAFRSMGAKIEEAVFGLECDCKSRLKGTQIKFPFPSVGATENVMIAAVLADGITILDNAAREPEICDLANFLNSCGAKIFGAGTKNIVIEGVKSLHEAEHRVIPDRIVATTFMAAAAITGGKILIRKVTPEHLNCVKPMFLEAGCTIKSIDDELLIKAPKKLNPLKKVLTLPYPGFPTDAQAILLAMTTVANGISLFTESIFTNRFKYTNELLKLGANVKIIGKTAIVNGADGLFGAKVSAFDLRGAAALIVAALKACGETEVTGLNYLDRGYEDMEKNLKALGANIERIKKDD